MVKASVQVVRDLKRFVLGTVSRQNKLFSKSAAAGTRAAPAQSGSYDINIGGRIDHGDIHTKDGKLYRRHKLQWNSKAANPTTAKLANKNSHKVIAEVDVPLDEEGDREEIIERVFEELEAKVNK